MLCNLQNYIAQRLINEADILIEIRFPVAANTDLNCKPRNRINTRSPTVTI